MHGLLDLLGRFIRLGSEHSAETSSLFDDSIYSENLVKEKFIIPVAMVNVSCISIGGILIVWLPDRAPSRFDMI